MTVFGLSGTVNVQYEFNENLDVDATRGGSANSVNGCVEITNSITMGINSDGPLFTTLGAGEVTIYEDEVTVLSVRESSG